jgi:hypothetical protein
MVSEVSYGEVSYGELKWDAVSVVSYGIVL